MPHSDLSDWNPRETRRELTRHARADNVQAHGDSPVDFLGKEERVVCGTAFRRKLPGLLPGPDIITAYTRALALNPI